MLPPVGSRGGGRPLDDRGLERRAGQLMADVPDRAFDNALLEMRRGDRDRDRVIGPLQLKVTLDKYKVSGLAIWQLQNYINQKNTPAPNKATKISERQTKCIHHVMSFGGSLILRSFAP